MCKGSLVAISKSLSQKIVQPPKSELIYSVIFITLLSRENDTNRLLYDSDLQLFPVLKLEMS